MKFEKAAEEWKNIAYTDYERKRPRQVQASFLGDCLESGLDTNVLSIRDVFYKYERPFIRAEDFEWRREYENSKKR